MRSQMHEMSEMSVMDAGEHPPVELPPPSTTAIKESDELQNRSGLVLICSFVFVVLALAGTFIAYTRTAQTQAVETVEPTPVYASHSGGPPPPAVEPEEPTLPPKIRKVRRVKRTRPSTTTTTTKKVLEYAPFLCTVSEDADFMKFVFPPDGMCEVIYFEMIYIHYVNMVGKPMSKSLTDYLKVAKALTNKTQYGIGISFYNYTAMWKLWETERHRVHAYIDVFAEYNVNNYAMLDIMGRFHNDFFVSFIMMDEFQDYHKSKGQHVGFNAAVSIYDNETLYRGYLGGRLNTKTVDFVKPHIKYLRYWVFLGHYPTDDYVDAFFCFIKTPHIFFSQKDKNKYLLGEHRSMLDAYFYEIFLRVYHPFLNKFPRALSFTLKPYNQKPLYPDNNEPSIGNYSWDNKCACNPPRDPTLEFLYPPGWKMYTTPGEICRDPVFFKNMDCNPKNPEDGCITYDKQRELVVVWDDVKTTRAKICLTRMNLTFLYGLMAYSIDYDDWNYECPTLSPYGPYSRLRLLYKLNDYLRGYYYTPDDLSGCMKVEPEFVSLEDFRKIQTWPEGGV